MRSLQKPSVFSSSLPSSAASPATSLESKTAALAMELMNASTTFHKLHLVVTGIGSYASHKALNALYDELPEHADDLAEGFQGAAEKLLDYPETAPRCVYSVDEAISYLRDLTGMVNSLQAVMPYSEIVNGLDNVKTTINSIKYKLLFLK